MMTTHKDSAINFLRMVISGKTKDAYAKHVSPNIIHHNAYFASDPASLERGMQENHDQFPNKRFDIKHALEDVYFVAVHSHLTFKKGEPGMAVVHLFRFAGDKIAEMWDVGQQVPKDPVNVKGMF